LLNKTTTNRVTAFRKKSN